MPRGIRVNGAAIRVIRERSGLSGVEFGKRCGVNRAYIANVELGYRQTVSPRTAQAIADALKCPLDAILAMPEERAS